MRICFSMAAAMLEAISRLSPASIVSVLISDFELKVKSLSSETYSRTNSFIACWSIMSLCQVATSELWLCCTAIDMMSRSG